MSGAACHRPLLRDGRRYFEGDEESLWWVSPHSERRGVPLTLAGGGRRYFEGGREPVVGEPPTVSGAHYFSYRVDPTYL